MSNYLKIYDFVLTHRQNSTNTTYYSLATDHPDLISYINVVEETTENIDRQLVFDSFSLKLANDLNSEILKDTKNKKIIKKSRDENLSTREIIKDYDHKILYGILHAGKVTDKSILEKRIEQSDGRSEFEYERLDGDRIYDDFFFLLHTSFRCNIARLFILTRKNNTNVDAVMKKYLRDNLFKSTNFSRTKCAGFVSDDYRTQVLNRSLVSSISISKSETILSESDNMEYEVEIRLKPKSDGVFARITNATVNRLKRSKVIIEDDSAEDLNSEIKFNIKDPTTGARKTISFGNQDDFMPSLVLDDDEILDSNSRIDIEMMKEICMEYIQYDGDQLN